jgi:hypothetical protein
MAAHNRSSRTSRFPWALTCGLVIAAALILVVAAGAFLFLHGRAHTQLSAYVNAPATEARVDLLQPVDVVAGATDLGGVSRVEVYADGALILAQDSTGQGATELPLIGTWLPLTTGRHALMARGYGSKGQEVDSQIVFVNVVQGTGRVVINVDSLPREAGASNPSLDTLATYLGTTPDELTRLNPDLGGVGRSDPLPPGSHVDAPPRPASPPAPAETPAPLPGAPAAPTDLTVAPTCINATLNWHASADAQAYRVYRVGPGPGALQVVADGLHVLTFTDPLPATGRYGYQVAAMRDGRRGMTPLLWVQTPADCPASAPAPGTAGDLVLTIAMVQTDALWDGIFCYLTVNGSEEHIPPGSWSYFSPAASEAHYYDLTVLPEGGRYNLNDQPVGTPVTLGRECMGRSAWRSESLGHFSVSRSREQWDGSLQTVRSDQFSFSYCLGPRSIPCIPPIPSISPPEPPADGTVSIGLFLPDLMFYFPAPTNLRFRPGSDLWNDLDSCSVLPDPLDRLDCASNDIWGRQMLWWDWEGTAIYPESSLTGYMVTRTNLRTGMSNTWEVSRRSDGTLPKRFYSSDRELCGAEAEYRVLARRGASQSRQSDPIRITSQPCPGAADVRIGFDTINIMMAYDRDEPHFFTPLDRTLEVYGSLFASGGTMVPTRIVTHGVGGISMSEGSNSFGDMDLYASDPYIGSTGRGHNIFRTRISDSRQSITFGVWLSEIDTDLTGYYGRTQTEWCSARLTMPGRDLHYWSTMNETQTLQDRDPQGDCTITVHLVGSPVP